MSSCKEAEMSALLERQQVLTQAWIALTERSMQLGNASSPQELEATVTEQMALLEQLRLFLNTCEPGQARAYAANAFSRNSAAARDRLALELSRAAVINRQFHLALQAGEQFVTTRLHVLRAAAGAVDVYSGGGQIAQSRWVTSGNVTA